MAITFRVDEVVPASERLPTVRLREAVGEALAIGGDPETRVIAPFPAHPLIDAVHRAFAQHRPLVLSPDAVWLTLAQGVAQHVKLHADALRPRLVRHAGKQVLAVRVEAIPTDAASWAQVVEGFRGALADAIGEGRARLFECDFSTTTEVERVASQVVLMDIYAPYYDYYLAAVCGIPEITLAGTPDDWRAIRARIDVIGELDLAWWTSSLIPIADQFVRAAEGAPEVTFWRRIYNPRDAYGGEVITGWITRLFPYLQDAGKVATRNPMLALAIDEPRDQPSRDDGYDGPGVRSNQLPAGPSTVRIVVEDLARSNSSEVALDGGVLAVAQDDAGRLRPIGGWVLRTAAPTMRGVIDRIRTDHQATVAPVRDWRAQLRVHGPAELVALYDQLDGAILFADAAPWRLRALDEQERVELGLPHGRTYSVLRILDLPDGTYVALADTHPPVYVRGRADALVPLRERSRPRSDRAYTADDIAVHPRPRHSRESVADVEVVGVSLAVLLEGVLAAGGRVELVAQARLLDRLPERWLRAR